jgi:hypothetical protein
MSTTTKDVPAIVETITRYECPKCGNNCSCGVPYVPKTERAADYAKANPEASVRQIAKATGASVGTAHKAKAGVHSEHLNTTTGRDGKKYQATKAKAASLGDRQPTVLWSTLHSIAREYLDTDPAKIVGRMDDDMRGDVRELVPRIVEWLLNAAKVGLDEQ